MALYKIYENPDGAYLPESPSGPSSPTALANDDCFNITALMYSLATLLAWLQCLVLQLPLVAASPAPVPAPEPLLSGLTTLIGNIGNAPPPKILWTPKPSPQCAVINQGQLQCCRGALAGDQPLVVFLANLYGYRLNPDNINGLVCKHSQLPVPSRCR